MVDLGKRYGHHKADGLMLRPVRTDSVGGVYAEVLAPGVTRLRQGGVYRFVEKDLAELDEGKESGHGPGRSDVRKWGHRLSQPL